MASATSVIGRLRDRLGLGVTVPLGDRRLLEALNAGVARAYADGVPGLTSFTLLGKIYTDLTGNVSSHTPGKSILTLDTVPALVFPGDILVAHTSDEYLIYDVNRADSKIDLGIPVEEDLTGVFTIHRRSLLMPEACTVYKCVADPHSEDLNPETSALARFGTLTGRARSFKPGFLQASGENYINFAPAPTEGSVFRIQLHNYSDRITLATPLNFPEAVLDAVLERARKAYLLWSGAIGQVELGGAMEGQSDTDNQLKAAGSERAARIQG